MKRKLIFTLFILSIASTLCSAQLPRYTAKHFVVYKDTNTFKPIGPSANGFSRVYIEVESPEIWDTDDDYTTQVTGYTPALVCIEGNFKDGKMNGVFTSYLIDSFDHSKRYKICEQTYVNDKLNGEWRTYFLSGNLVKTANFKNDSLHGISRKFWIDGKTIEEETEYSSGNTHIVRTYFRSGKLEKEIPYENEMIHGFAKSYYESGQLKEELAIVNGEAHGLTKRYYENGVLMEELNMVRNQFHGTRKYYHPNGQLWSVDEYKNGLPWNAIANYTDKGIKRPQGTLKYGTGTLILYEDNGSVSETLNFIGGRQQ